MRRELHEEKGSSCIAPTQQPFGGSVMISESCVSSALCSAVMLSDKVTLIDYLNIVGDHVLAPINGFVLS